MEYLNTKQVCDTLHISKKKAYELFNLKGFPYIKIGRNYLVGDKDLEEFLNLYKHSQINLLG